MTAASVLPLLERAFGAWKGAGADAAAIAPLPAAPQLTKRQIYLIDKPGAAQSQIRIGWVGVPRSTPDYPTLAGAQHDSRRLVHVAAEHEPARDARLLVRRVLVVRRARSRPGRSTRRAGVQTDKTAEALKEFFNELTGILKPIPGDELDKAKNYVALGFPAEFETTGDLARKMEEQVVHSLPDEYFPSYIRSVVQVDRRRTCEKAAARYIQPDKFAVVIVGDRKVDRGRHPRAQSRPDRGDDGRTGARPDVMGLV